MNENLRPELDAAEKMKGHLFLKETILQISFYLAAALQYANHEAKLPDEEFWKALFYCSSHTQREVVLSSRDGNDPQRCPEHPYEKLDFQACNKYLLFGGERMLPQGGFATDSLNFYKTFRLPFRTNQDGSTFPRDPYQSVLRRAIALRNDKSHDNPETIARVTRRSIEDSLSTLRQLTDPPPAQDRLGPRLAAPPAAPGGVLEAGGRPEAGALRLRPHLPGGAGEGALPGRGPPEPRAAEGPGGGRRLPAPVLLRRLGL